MKKELKKQLAKGRRAHRVRFKIRGTAERPRLHVFRSLAHISVQLIDDTSGKTIVAADDRGLKGKKQEQATEVGKRIAEAAKKKGIVEVLFDRGPNRYHGRVKALADGAREGGLKF